MSIVNIKSTTGMSALHFVYYGSTNFEKDGTRGISHLMEHLVCSKFSDLEDDFEKDCIEWNAYTDDNQIVFYFKGLEECLSKYRDKIIKRMYKPLKVTKKMLEEEKSIVLQELDENFKDISVTHYCLFFRRYYDHFSAFGSHSDIKNFTVDMCNDYYKQQYDIPDKIISQSKDFVLELDSNKYGFAERKHQKKKLKLKKKVSMKEIELYKKAFGSDIKNIFMIKEISKKDMPVARIIAQCFDGSLNSPLMSEVREKRGLVYGISFDCDVICGNYFMMLNTVTSAKNEEAVLTTIDDVFKNYSQYITEERLGIVTHSQKIAIKISECYGTVNLDDLSEGEAKFREKLDTITLQEVYDFCDKYLKGNKDFTCIEVF